MEYLKHEQVRALVVEDSLDAMNVLVRLLAMLDCDACGCTDGATGIGLARTHHPHLIFLDLAMPGINGFETAARLQDEELPPYLLVALTAFGDTETMEHCATVGFQCHVLKPIEMGDLRVLLDEARNLSSFIRT